MTAQLEAMAAAAELDLLAYFLGMAKEEAGYFLRMTAEADRGDGTSNTQGGDRDD